MRIRLNSAVTLGCVRFFFGSLEQSFPEGIIKPYLVFRLISGYIGERLSPGLRRKDWILRALLLAVTSLWPQRVGFRVEIYSARWKFMPIHDQAKDLVKN